MGTITIWAICTYIDILRWRSMGPLDIRFNFHQHCKEPLLKIRNKCSQKSNCTATVLISTIMYLWAIYIFLRLICLFSYIKYVDQSWGDIKIAHRHINVEIGTEAAQFPEKEYINEISVAVPVRMKWNPGACMTHMKAKADVTGS